LKPLRPRIRKSSDVTLFADSPNTAQVTGPRVWESAAGKNGANVTDDDLKQVGPQFLALILRKPYAQSRSSGAESGRLLDGNTLVLRRVASQPALGHIRSDHMASLTERILDECSKRGTCMLSRAEFDETFAGLDLAIQVRGAIDFAQQHDLAFARSTGDHQFLFSRLPKGPNSGRHQLANERRQVMQAGKRRRSRPGFKGKANGASRRPFGRSF
jgi:hypothetical protein